MQQPSFVDADSAADEADDDSSSSYSSTTGPDSEDSSTDISLATRRLRLPETLASSSAGYSSKGVTANTAQLAVALSALKFALVLEAAKTPGVALQCAAAAAGGAEGSTPATAPQSSPLRRLKKATLSKVSVGTATADANSGAGEAAEQPIIAGEYKGAAAAAERTQDASAKAPAHQAAAAEKPSAVQYCGGSGCIAGGQYGDGPLLASAVLLQLSGQSRKHALLDATSRIAYWVEYDSVKESGTAQTINAASKGLTTGLATAGGIDPSTADGIAPPQPRSKKRQEEQAEADARLKQQQAAQQQLLQRLAAVARQADRVAHDGSSIAARFAPPAHAHAEQVRLRVYRADLDALCAADTNEGPGASRDGTSGGVCTASAEPSGKWVRFSSTGGRGRTSTASGVGTTPKQCATKAVPVRSEVLGYAPAVKPWADLAPCNKPIQAHPQLPMPRPRPLLLPHHLAATAFRTVPSGAAAGEGVAHPAGRLVPAAGVTPAAGLVAAARAVHAREAMLATMPRAAVYSFSVMSDHNRSGRPDDGYSKAPSSFDWDSLEVGVAARHTHLCDCICSASTSVVCCQPIHLSATLVSCSPTSPSCV